MRRQIFSGRNGQNAPGHEVFSSDIVLHQYPESVVSRIEDEAAYELQSRAVDSVSIGVGVQEKALSNEIDDPTITVNDIGIDADSHPTQTATLEQRSSIDFDHERHIYAARFIASCERPDQCTFNITAGLAGKQQATNVRFHRTDFYRFEHRHFRFLRLGC